MAAIKTEIFGIALESTFKTAILFRDAHLDDAARKCLEIFAGSGLAANQILISRGDEVFNYTLSFSLFNGHGAFSISSEKLNIFFNNAKGEKDLELIVDCVAKFYENVPLPEIGNTSISATVHATFTSNEEMDKYFGRYANPAKQIVSGGAIANIQCENWSREVRLSVERSLAYSCGAFLSWLTNYPVKKPSREMLKALGGVFVEAAEKMDLTWTQTA